MLVVELELVGSGGCLQLPLLKSSEDTDAPPSLTVVFSRPDCGCFPGCDLDNLLTVDFEAQTAVLTDARQDGPSDGTRFSSSWYWLMRCTMPGSLRQSQLLKQRSEFDSMLRGEVMRRLFSDFTTPEYGLRARMAWFFLNFYATPASVVGDWLMMYHQYSTIFEGALGNYRRLSFSMFTDRALRKSLDQVKKTCCPDP